MYFFSPFSFFTTTTMSYASVVSHNTSPNQPKPDPALLNTDVPTASGVADDAAKVNLVSSDFRENPATITSTFLSSSQHSSEEAARKPKGSMKNSRNHHDQKPSTQWLSVVQEAVLRPTVAGGLVGIVNIGIIGCAGYAFYTEAHLRRNPRVLSATIAGTVALLGLEGYAIEKLSQDESHKHDSAVIAQYFRENPSKSWGLLGVLNIGVAGMTGYIMYENWEEWDNKTICAFAGGIFTLWAGEGYLLSTSES